MPKEQLSKETSNKMAKQSRKRNAKAIEPMETVTYQPSKMVKSKQMASVKRRIDFNENEVSNKMVKQTNNNPTVKDNSKHGIVKTQTRSMASSKGVSNAVKQADSYRVQWTKEFMDKV